MKFTLGKQERLKSKKLIEKLFLDGSSIKSFPIRLIYLQTNHNGQNLLQASFSVPKRNFKKAVDRNRIKRLLREAYRLQKNELHNSLQKPYIIMFTFIGKEEPSYVDLEQKISKILSLFIQKENKI